jgi:arginine N-succinyltransferase
MTANAIHISSRVFAARDIEAIKALTSAEVTDARANEFSLTLSRALATLDQHCPEREQVSVYIASQQNEVVGYIALIHATGFDPLRFWLRRSTIVHASSELAIFNRCQTLTLCNDMVGDSELVSVISSQLNDAERMATLTQLLASAVKHWRERLTSHRLVMQLGGVKTDSGDSVFWRHYGQHFAPPSVSIQSHGRAALAALLPHHPVYLSFLDAQAQRVVAQAAQSEQPLQQQITALGFIESPHIDCIDGGPLLALHR